MHLKVEQVSNMLTFPNAVPVARDCKWSSHTPNPLDVQNLGKFWVTLEQFAGDRCEVPLSAGYQLGPNFGDYRMWRAHHHKEGDSLAGAKRLEGRGFESQCCLSSVVLQRGACLWKDLIESPIHSPGSGRIRTHDLFIIRHVLFRWAKTAAQDFKSFKISELTQCFVSRYLVDSTQRRGVVDVVRRQQVVTVDGVHFPTTLIHDHRLDSRRTSSSDSSCSGHRLVKNKRLKRIYLFAERQWHLSQGNL